MMSYLVACEGHIMELIIRVQTHGRRNMRWRNDGENSYCDTDAGRREVCYGHGELVLPCVSERHCLAEVPSIGVLQLREVRSVRPFKRRLRPFKRRVF